MESIEELMNKYTLKELKVLFEEIFGILCDYNNKQAIASTIYDYRASEIRTADLCKILGGPKAKRTSVTPQTDAFIYDNQNQMLVIAGKAKVCMHPKDVIDFMNSIRPLLNTRYRQYTGPAVKNTPEALRNMLVSKNYTKMLGPIDCEVWGCFHANKENLLMLEIIYPRIGSIHINVALDLSKF